jgi:RHS repeat-associated protein
LDGNMLTNGVWSFTWDAEIKRAQSPRHGRRATAILRPGRRDGARSGIPRRSGNRYRLVSATSNNVLRVVNAYDHQSRRIRKEVSAWDEQVAAYVPQSASHYLWDGWNIFRETVTVGSGSTQSAVTNYNTWGSDLSGSLQGAGGVGGLLAVTTVSAADPQPVIYFPLFDANGNVTEYISTNGTVAARYAYDAFGATVAQSGDMADAFTHRFSTKPFDAETGIVMYQLRSYSSPIGRWLSRDPITEEGSLNLFVICNNDVINKWDYLGMFLSITDAEITDHFLKLEDGLKAQLKAMCPKSKTSWPYGKKTYCCNPDDCANEAERMADAYIKALEHAYRVRKYPGGGTGNFAIIIEGGLGSGQTYGDVEGTGLTCGGWSDMGQSVLQPTIDKSKCWRYKNEMHWSTIVVFNRIIWCPHMWSSLQIMNGDKIHLDPWKSGGWWY